MGVCASSERRTTKMFLNEHSNNPNEHGKIMVSLISFLNEHISLNKYAVNLGAEDGITSDPTYALYSSFHFDGVAFEPDKARFTTLIRNLPQHVIKVCDYATPENVLGSFNGLKVPLDADVMKIDIDGYDYFVTKEILKKYTPKVLCVEAQPIFPPKLNFTMSYFKEYSGWDSSMCVGASLELMTKMIRNRSYELIYLDWYDAYFIRKDLFHLFGSFDSSIDSVWMNGWFNKPRDNFGPKFAHFDNLKNLNPQAQLDFINEDDNFKGKKYTLFHDDISYDDSIIKDLEIK